jgi:hypothetical protein
MFRRLITYLGAAILLFLIAWMGYTQNPAQPPKLTLNKVAEDLYEI